jgi:hypothetical protein
MRGLKVFAAVALGILLSAIDVLAGSDEETTAFQHLNLLAAQQGMFSSGAIDLGGEKYFTFTKNDKQGHFFICVPITVTDQNAALAFQTAWWSASMTAAAYQETLEGMTPKIGTQTTPTPSASPRQGRDQYVMRPKSGDHLD